MKYDTISIHCDWPECEAQVNLIGRSLEVAVKDFESRGWLVSARECYCPDHASQIADAFIQKVGGSLGGDGSPQASGSA